MSIGPTFAIFIVILSSACRRGAEKCVEGASVLCACASGQTGAQVCNASGTFGPCTCAAGVGDRKDQSKSDRCAFAALNCSAYSDGGAVGWELHKRVFAARQAAKYAEALCLAERSVSSPDHVLAGASHFEASNAWHELGCEAQAVAEVEASLEVRPHGRNGWKETCDWCKQLGATCKACQREEEAPCPTDLKAASLLSTALKTGKKIIVLKCATGRFPDAGWAFVAWIGERTDQSLNHGGSIDDGQAAHLHHVVISTLGKVLADDNREATWHERNDDEDTTTVRLQAADLDGDGVDEVFEETQYTRRGWTIGALDAYVINRGALSSALHVQTSYDDSGMAREGGDTHCEATWEVGRSALTITAKKPSGPDVASQCTKSTRYELRSGKFVSLR